MPLAQGQGHRVLCGCVPDRAAAQLLSHAWHEKLDRHDTVQMEVGIEDCLHIEFEYDKGRYHLKDTVVGKIYFLLVSF